MMEKILLLTLFTIAAAAVGDGDNCPALDEDGVEHFDIKLPNDLQIPQVQTFYVCKQFKIPEALLNDMYHIVAFEALVDNVKVLHHMILFACQDGTPESKVHRCGKLENPCRSFLTVWSLGFDGRTCLYPKTGISIGKGGHQTLSLQTHWNNEHKAANISDSSGVRVYYTRKTNKYELGNVQIGQEDIEIAPGSTRVKYSGSCSPYCTNQLFSSPFYLTRTFIHMHSLGVAGRLDQYRNGTHLRNIAYDPGYSYKKPPVHYHPRAIKILPGDEVKLTCWFSTTGEGRERNKTVYWGEGVEGEMCYAFVSYFPRTTGFDQCVQYSTYDQCDNYNNQTLIMGKCNFKTFTRDMGGELGLIRQKCDEKTTPKCQSICARSVQKIYRHPCMQGRLAVFLKHRVLRTVNWTKLARIRDLLIDACDNPMK